MKPEIARLPATAIMSLSNCLIEGDPLQERRARNFRRRAILFSVVLQSIAVTAILILPLLGKGQHISTVLAAPLPPFRLGSDHPNRPAGQHVDNHLTTVCLYFKLSPNSGKPSRPTTNFNPGDLTEELDLPTGPRGTPDGVLDGLEPSTHKPARPQADPPHNEPRQRVTIAHIDLARLTSRVEPVYPHLGVVLRHETRVELEAIISTDGSIQSLQVLSGDPLFYDSALAAVRQWRYTPTILNGRPVEVDTHITVIYTLTH